MRRGALTLAEPAFRDRSGHATHWIRPHGYSGHDELRPRRMLCVGVRSVASLGADPAISVGANRRRCTHRAGSDMSNTLLARIARRKPIGDLCKERFRAADSSDHRRSAATKAFLFRGKDATDLETKSGQCGAPSGTAPARPARTAAGTAACSAGATAQKHFTLVSELIGQPGLQCRIPARGTADVRCANDGSRSSVH
jgi:hypothetical protein